MFPQRLFILEQTLVIGFQQQKSRPNSLLLLNIRTSLRFVKAWRNVCISMMELKRANNTFHKRKRLDIQEMSLVFFLDF